MMKYEIHESMKKKILLEFICLDTKNNKVIVMSINDKSIRQSATVLDTGEYEEKTKVRLDQANTIPTTILSNSKLNLLADVSFQGVCDVLAEPKATSSIINLLSSE